MSIIAPALRLNHTHLYTIICGHKYYNIVVNGVSFGDVLRQFAEEVELKQPFSILNVVEGFDNDFDVLRENGLIDFEFGNRYYG